MERKQEHNLIKSGNLRADSCTLMEIIDKTVDIWALIGKKRILFSLVGEENGTETQRSH